MNLSWHVITFVLIVFRSIALKSRVVSSLLQRAVVSDFCLELDKLLSHLISRPLRQNPQNCPACLVHLDSATESKPAGTRTLERKLLNWIAVTRAIVKSRTIQFSAGISFDLIDDILQLHHRHAHQPVVTAEAVVLDWYVELVRSHLLLVTNVAAIRKE